MTALRDMFETVEAELSKEKIDWGTFQNDFRAITAELLVTGVRTNEDAILLASLLACLGISQVATQLAKVDTRLARVEKQLKELKAAL